MAIALAPWQLTGAADFGTSNKLGGGTVTGFRFSVRSINGELPTVRTVVNQAAAQADRLTLYRRYATNAYAVFCEWDQEKSPPSEHGALILPPGDYLFPTSTNDPGPHRDSILLTGDMIDAEGQLDAFQIYGGTNYNVFPTNYGANLPGFKFTVPARTDGFELFVDQIIDDVVRSSGDQVHFYRKKTTGEFALFAAWNPRKSPSPTGIMLPAGEYQVVSSQALSNPVKFKYTVLLTGTFALPD